VDEGSGLAVAVGSNVGVAVSAVGVGDGEGDGDGAGENDGDGETGVDTPLHAYCAINRKVTPILNWRMMTSFSAELLLAILTNSKHL
jgi:hypothetical protein